MRWALRYEGVDPLLDTKRLFLFFFPLSTSLSPTPSRASRSQIPRRLASLIKQLPRATRPTSHR